MWRRWGGCALFDMAGPGGWLQNGGYGVTKGRSGCRWDYYFLRMEPNLFSSSPRLIYSQQTKDCLWQIFFFFWQRKKKQKGRRLSSNVRSLVALCRPPPPPPPPKKRGLKGYIYLKVGVSVTKSDFIFRPFQHVLASPSHHSPASKPVEANTAGPRTPAQRSPDRSRRLFPQRAPQQSHR